MSERREINKVRTDYLEKTIAMYIFRGEIEAANAIKKLAQEINAPIYEKDIKDRIAFYKKIEEQE